MVCKKLMFLAIGARAVSANIIVYMVPTDHYSGDLYLQYISSVRSSYQGSPAPPNHRLNHVTHTTCVQKGARASSIMEGTEALERPKPRFES